NLPFELAALLPTHTLGPGKHGFALAVSSYCGKFAILAGAGWGHRRHLSRSPINAPKIGLLLGFPRAQYARGTLGKRRTAHDTGTDVPSRNVFALKRLPSIA